MTTREEGLARIKALATKYGSKLEALSTDNEAQVRLLVINEVLEALGWPKDEFAPETRTRQGNYLDYQLTADGVPRLIVEAKRRGHTFAAPRSRLKKTEYLVSYMQSAFAEPFSEVLKQAEQYAVETRIPFGLLTNGAEWALVQLIAPPGINSRNVKCFYFGNLLVGGNFDQLWELASREAVLAGNLEEGLNSLNTVQSSYSVEPRVSLGELAIVSEEPREAFVGDFYSFFFDEIVESPRRRMLQQCFVTNTKLDQFEGELRRALQDAAPPFMGDKVEELTPGDHRQLLDDESGDQKGRVVIVAGAVGAGKTTFITKAMVEERANKGLRFLRLDLVDEVSERTDSFSFWGEVYKSWSGKFGHTLADAELRKVFHTELKRFREGPESRAARGDDELEILEARHLASLASDPETFIVSTWTHSRRQSRVSVVLCLDNVDRAAESFQKEAYAFAHKIAAKTGATVIITMREGTYFRGKKAGFLDVRANDTVFHLQAPDFMQLVAKRIKYVENDLDEDHRASTWRARADYSDFRAAMARHAAALKASFQLQVGGADSVTSLAAVSWHSVRQFFEALLAIHGALGSSSAWTHSEVLAAALVPCGVESPVVGAALYRPVSRGHACYFLKVRLLLFLIHGLKTPEKRRGVRADRLVDFARTYGYQSGWTRQAIVELVRDRMLECMELPTEQDFTREYEFADTHSFRSSPLAVVVLERWCTENIFLTVAGWELAFQDHAFLARAVDAGRQWRDACVAESSKRAQLGLLELCTLGEVTSAYLRTAYDREKLQSGHLRQLMEIAVTEDRLAALVERLHKPATTSVAQSKSKSSTQMVLFAGEPTAVYGCAPDSTGVEDKTATRLPVRLIPIPTAMAQLHKERSKSVPLVLWTLVNFRANGVGKASGAEITRVINEYLVDDLHRVEPTNISRALRGPGLRSQPWLQCLTGEREGQTVFGLQDGWREAWKAIFGEEGPSV